MKKLIRKTVFITTWALMAVFTAVSAHDNYIGMKACQINYEVEECTKGVVWQPTEIKLAMEKLR